MTPELRWLRSFPAVAEEQRSSRAALRLNVAQPALTAHIQQLEAAVGATLFERTNRMEGLTPAGRALLPEAEVVVKRAQGLARKVREVAHGDTGLPRLGVIPPAATSAVADLLRRLARELPGVEVQVRQGNQDRLENLLLDGDLDWMVPAGFGVAPCSLLLTDALPAGLVAKPVRPALPKLASTEAPRAGRGGLRESRSGFAQLLDEHSERLVLRSVGPPACGDPQRLRGS